MTDKPTALRLADALDDFAAGDCCLQRTKAAAELRRLHAENERLKAHIVRWKNRMECELIPMAESLEAQRDELLEALRGALRVMPVLPEAARHIVGMEEKYKAGLARARAAIARAEGGQK